VVVQPPIFCNKAVRGLRSFRLGRLPASARLQDRRVLVSDRWQVSDRESPSSPAWKTARTVARS
jgi:hypothetical protein